MDDYLAAKLGLAFSPLRLRPGKKGQVARQANKSNKTDDAVKLPIARLAYSVEIPDKGKQKRTIYVLKPLIDKLSFVCHLPTQEEHDGIGAWLWGLAKDDDYPQFQPAPSKVGFGSRYKKNVIFTAASTGRHVLIQADPKKQEAASMRFEFNPAKLGRKGLIELQEAAPAIFGGHHDFSWVIANAYRVKIDVACDILNVGIDSLIFQSAKAGKSITYHGVSGRPETTYLGLLYGKPGPLKSYNKAQQLWDADRPPQFGDLPHTRIEVTVRTKLRIGELDQLPNQFEKIKVVCPWIGQAPDEPHVWMLFLDSCRLRGLTGALKRIPEGSRPAYAAALAEAKQLIWDPKKLWGFWQEALAIAGLSSQNVGS
jgi:hypothetical protein